MTARSRVMRVAALALWTVALATPRASAQQAQCASADAEEERAQRLREDGRDLDAVRVLEAVVACERLPRRVARLGLAEAAAGLWVQSEAHLAEALGTSDPWVRRVRRDLAAQLARVREHVGHLEVIVNAPTGEVRIGGTRVATLPMSEPVRVPAGSLTYEIVAPGFVREVRRVEIAAGGRAAHARERRAHAGAVGAAAPRGARGARGCDAAPCAASGCGSSSGRAPDAASGAAAPAARDLDAPGGDRGLRGGRRAARRGGRSRWSSARRPRSATTTTGGASSRAAGAETRSAGATATRWRRWDRSRSAGSSGGRC